MDLREQLRAAWNPYQESIRQVLGELSRAEIPDECDFLWFVLFPQELAGLPITVWPTERNQQQHDGWDHEFDLQQIVPKSVQLPKNAASTIEACDELRDATAEFLTEQWSAIFPRPTRLAYFSFHEDGFYFSMRNGTKVSAWDIDEEIGRSI